MTNAQATLSAIEDALSCGRTVYVCNSLRATKVTPKTAAKWKQNGHTLFKVDGNSLLMAAGRRFDCIDYCAIRVV